MWDHVRLLRGTLLMMSLLTLSRLHVQQEQPADCWTAAWLLPLLHSLVFSVGCMAATLEAGSALEMMHIMVVILSIVNGLLIMLFFMRYKGRLVSVLRRLAALEKTSAAHRRPGELNTVQAQFAVIVGLSVTASIMSQAQFFSSGQLLHPNYPNPVLVPAALQTPVWYWVIVSLQTLHDISYTAMNAGCDLLVIGLADAVALLLERLGRQLGSGGDSDGQASEEESEARKGSVENKLSGKEVFLVGPEVRLNHRKEDTEATAEMSTIVTRAQVVMSARIRPACGNLVPAASTSASPESRLSQLVSTHRAVRRLASDATDLCSLPVLCLYTTVTVTLLLSVYITIARLKFSTSGAPTNVAYVALMLLRLLIVSSAGSRLIQQGEQLHAALTDAGWQEDELTPAARLSLQLLLEKTRHTPGFHGWGLFTAQKTTMLSMLGFVLTYTVILMQMVT